MFCWEFSGILFFKSKFPYLHLAELVTQAHAPCCYLLITCFSWLKVLGRHASPCATPRLADSQLLLLLQPLLGSLPPLLTECVWGLSTCCSSRGPKFGSQHPRWAAQDYPYLQIPGMSPSSGLLVFSQLACLKSCNTRVRNHGTMGK